MNRAELIKLIDKEVSEVVKEPLMEPEIKKPVYKPVYYEPVKRENDELDAILFYGGRKDKYAD